MKAAALALALFFAGCASAPPSEPAYPTFRVYWIGRPEVGVLLITAPDRVTAWMLGCELLRCSRHMDIEAEPVEESPP